MNFKHVETFKDRYGKQRFYFRPLKNVRRIALPDPGKNRNASAEFVLAYNAALETTGADCLPLSENVMPRRLVKAKVEKKKKVGKIYVIQFSNWVKIGYSVSISQRMPALQTAIPEKIKFVASFPGTVKTERELHARFAKYREQGEWFRREGELDWWILSLGGLAN